MAQNSDSTSLSSPPMKNLHKDDSDVDSKIADLPLSKKKMHPKLWFEDGSVVIATQSHLFRVHRGILSLNSTVFSSLFSLPQPSEGNDSYEGLPVVTLVDDNEEDIAELLRTMYERNYYRKYQPTSYACISALLRSSTKYAVDIIRKEVIEHLALLYPSSLADYDVTDLKISERLFPELPGQPFTILSLARSVSADILLPALFYECALFDVDYILNYTPAEPDGLKWGEEDRSLCLAGRQKLIYATRETVFKFFDTPAPQGCMSRNKCVTTMHSNYTAEFKSFTQKPILISDVDVWTEVQRICVGGAGTLCTTCQGALRASADEGRAELWKKLPGYFGLPEWEVLKKRT